MMSVPDAGSFDSYEYVSFDIYDTLILRPYVRPTDLFRHMEVIKGCTGFAERRIQAEKNARIKYGREITLQEIYAELDPQYSSMIELEKDMEITVTVVNKEMLALYNSLLDQGKKIIIVSDMYLPKEIIESVLSKNGINAYYRLYVSSEYGVSKHNGELYGIILKDLSIRPEQLFHIGDNERSDVAIPKRMGISVYRYKRPIDQYISKNRDEYRFYKRKRTLERSILIGTDAIIGGGEKDIWYSMGQRYGGPLAVSFSLFIAGKSDKESLLLFASRDGFNLRRIITELFPDRRTGYVFAQRLLMDVLTESNLSYGRVEIPDKSTDRFTHARLSSAIGYILRFFSEELDDVPDGRAERMVYYNNNIEKIDNLRKERWEQYRNDLAKLCGDDKIELVDCTTMKFSSQRLIEKTIGRRVKGHYLVTLRADGSCEYDTMNDWHSPVIGWTNVDVPEFFLSSPELPLCGWNNGPIMGDEHGCEKFRSEIYSSVSDGELDYAKCYSGLFGKYAIPMDYWTVVKWSKLAAVRGTPYCDALKKIQWASDPDHNDYSSLIPGMGSIWQIMKKLIVSILFKMNGE